MKYLLFFGLLFGLIACTDDSDETVTSQKSAAEQKAELVSIENGTFTEYYPGKKQIKFQGPQDKEGRRHGIWYYYSQNGLQLSMTEYRHGLKNGISIVKYDNGVLHYTGEYQNDKKVGVWKTYNESGKLVDEKDYGI